MSIQPFYELSDTPSDIPILPLSVGQGDPGSSANKALEDHSHGLAFDWIPLTLVNAWVTYGAPYSAPVIAVVGDLIVVRGVVKNGGFAAAPSAVANIPTDLIPAYSQIFTSVHNAQQFCRLDVQDAASGGQIVLWAGVGNAFLSLDPIKYSLTA